MESISKHQTKTINTRHDNIEFVSDFLEIKLKAQVTKEPDFFKI